MRRPGKYRNVEDAIASANRLDVGLGASVWSSDPEQAAVVASRIQAGTVWINQHGMIHPMVPFGGGQGLWLGNRVRCRRTQGRYAATGDQHLEVVHA